MADWTPTDQATPPEGQVVEAMDSGGHVQLLKLRGRLWWFADGSMYVYFTPKFWRSVCTHPFLVVVGGDPRHQRCDTCGEEHRADA